MLKCVINEGKISLGVITNLSNARCGILQVSLNHAMDSLAAYSEAGCSNSDPCDVSALLQGLFAVSVGAFQS